MRNGQRGLRFLPYQLYAAAGLLLGGASLANGAIITTWTGGAGTDYATAGNWNSVVPPNNDWQYTSTFTENSPANKTPNLAANRNTQGINFANSAGWTFSGAQITLRELDSSGVGVNTFSANVKSIYNGYFWTVGAGNTLNLAGGLYQNEGGGTITLDGSGTLAIGSTIDGWSGTLKMNVQNGTLRVNGATPYKNGGAARITGADGAVELKTTVSAATALIGTKIVDVFGEGLSVTDIGGGYVRVAVVPEPASVAGIGLLATTLLSRRRRAR